MMNILPKKARILEDAFTAAPMRHPLLTRDILGEQLVAILNQFRKLVFRVFSRDSEFTISTLAGLSRAAMITLRP